MLIYCNIPVHYEIEDADVYDVQYDEYIFSYDGIFIKYKKHFYEMDLCKHVDTYRFNQQDFLVQQEQHKLNKNKIIIFMQYWITIIDIYSVNFMALFKQMFTPMTPYKSHGSSY